MKKLVLLLAFLGCAFLAEAKTNSETTLKTSIPTLKDSVVIEFGKAGRIVIMVESLADFEKLKGMNINQIISELGIQENKDTGEVTLVELHKKDGSVKEIVRVNENGPETEVRVGRMRVFVDESGADTKVKIETNPKTKEISRFKSDFGIDLGINNFLQEGSFPTSDQPFATKGWGSWNVGLNWIGSQRLSDGLRWNFGLGFQWYNFKFENRDFQAVRGRDQIGFVERTDVTGVKSKLSASYLTVMTLLQANLGKDKNKGLTLAAGPYIGYRLGGRSKFVYEESGRALDQTEKINTGLYLENLRYGLRGELGFGKHITFFSTYDLNELFQEGKGPALNPITFGIKLLND
ncbi:MAG: PorT family protein [Algoriphagus sp.]|nr:PorT family protein [Algoriphagus sp.]